MKLLLSATHTALYFATLLGIADGHGYMSDPLSRNYFSQLFGLDYGSSPDQPSKEYCFHCLNTKGPGSVCGTSEAGIDYDAWLASNGNPMPWNSHGNIYGEGETITIGSFLTAHHTGHVEVRACPDGRASSQDCFDAHVLEFVEDLSYGMPKDNAHPERGYYYGSPEFNNQAFSMRFKLPAGLVGDEVLLQWWYITANSCYPPGYDEYYNANSFLPKTFYNSVTSQCTPEQYTEVFYKGEWPERFVNCAEITIVSENDNDNGDDEDRTPTDAPVPPTDAPVSPTPAPNLEPVHVIEIFDPVPESNDNDNENEDNNDGDGGVGCCSNDYKTCATWCQDSRDQCEGSGSRSIYCAGMKWLDRGALLVGDASNCAPRWEACTDTGTAGCCEGLVCKGSSSYYKQCLSPGDPAPN